MNYPAAQDGEWFRPKRTGFKLQCCGCGLVHSVDFRLQKTLNGGRSIQMRATRVRLDSDRQK